jgi:hypothetical protein
LLEQANTLSAQVPRDAGGNADFGPVSDMSREAVKAFDILALENSRFKGAAPGAKRMTFRVIPSLFNIAGMYFPFTGESNVNPAGPSWTQPFTICHELAHRLGFAREDEANFAAFLACRAGESVSLRYSGYLNAFIYCVNALPFTARAELWQQADLLVLFDVELLIEHSRRYDGPLRQIGDAVNNRYLLTVGQPGGVAGYGMAVDLILAYYAKEGLL